MNFRDVLDQDPILRLVAVSAAELGVAAYVIGGYVRDLILNRPSHDIDIVCIGSGIALARAVAAKMGNDVDVVVFKNFGTATIRNGHCEVEFVGARKESYTRGSRQPVVEAGTLEHDQNRRDFTINTLALSLNDTDYGHLIDPHGGYAAIQNRIIKTPTSPDITFSDDPLRIMRGIRLATQLDFQIDPETFAAITRNVHRLSIVSGERITDELNKIILTETPSRGFTLLFHSGVLSKIFSELAALDTIQDNFQLTLQVLDAVARESDDVWVRWAAILHGIGKPATKQYDRKIGWIYPGYPDRGACMVPSIFRRMKLPLNHKMHMVVNLIKLHERPLTLLMDAIMDSAMRRLVVEAGLDLDALMILSRAVATSNNHQDVTLLREKFHNVETQIRNIEDREHLRNFQPAITGTDIMAIFNVPPSKIVGALKAELREAILDGTVHNEYNAALSFGKKIAASKYGLSVTADG